MLLCTELEPRLIGAKAKTDKVAALNEETRSGVAQLTQDLSGLPEGSLTSKPGPSTD